MIRPLFPFYGSKWNIARRYPPPRPGRVSEPFAGSAGYSLFWGCPDVALVDADPIIFGVWDYLIRATAAEVLALPEMVEPGDRVDNYSIPQEARWLIGFWLNRGSATPKITRTAFSSRTERSQLIWGPRAKDRIASQLDRVRGWTVSLGDFSTAPASETTFVDSPYGDKGKFYRKRFDEFERLGAWSRQREGLTIVCENAGATWLPFETLGSIKSTKGRSDEVVWINGDSRLL